ncbi:translation initiation factor, partial [Rhodococcus sp. PAE-6]|nr:translation initiation factor [Rhodococcus sp. PAE-6]
GTSARVVSIRGSTVMVRPKGVDDELPVETDELRATREPAGTTRAPAKTARTSGGAKPAPAQAAPAKVAPVQPATPRA